MSIKMATWLPGNAAQPEFAPASARRMAGSAVFGGTDQSRNWFHFPITSPVIVNDRFLRVRKVFVLYKMKFSAVRRIELWSGSTRKAAFNVPHEFTDFIWKHPEEINRNAFIDTKTAFTLEETQGHLLDFPQGLNIAVNVEFDSRLLVNLPFGQTQLMPQNKGMIEFFSVGADWDEQP